MPPPLTADGQVTYADGTAGDPRADGARRRRLPRLDRRAELEARKNAGLAVLDLPAVRHVLAYMAYQNVWAGRKH